MVRFLGNKIEKDYDNKKPNAQVDPSMIHAGSGARHFRPVAPLIQDGSSTRYIFIDSKDNGSSNVHLDVYLFPPPASSEAGERMTLARQYGEAASNCLNRLGLNLSRKFKSKSDGLQGKKSKQKPGEVAQCVPFVAGEVVDISRMSNAEFWGMGAERPLTIQISMNEIAINLYVEVNPPTVLSISTFENFGAELFPGVPILVEAETIFASRAIVDWYADGDRICHDSFLYIPTAQDANKRLEIMVTPVRAGHNGDGCQEAYRFVERVAEMRPTNTTLDVRPSWKGSRNRGTLRILSYNILADQNAFSGPDRKSFFPWVSENVLKRTRRMPLILHEILTYQADVICLQEVDQIIFDTLLKPVLGYYNYQGFYSVKQTAGNQEGCAMFWSLDKFHAAHDNDYYTYSLSRLLECYEKPLEGSSPDWKPHAAVITEIFRLRPDLLDVIKTKLGHVLQIAQLRGLNGSPLIVSNTHLFFHPIAPHVRLMQLFAIAHQLTIEQGSESTPFILCGDLNTSLKNCAVLLMNRHVPKNHRDYRECFNSFVWNSDRSQNLEGTNFDFDFPEIRLPDSFPNLETAYPDYPDFTHYIIGFHATLDHILMTPKTSAGELRFLRQAEMPTLEQVTKDQAMPSPSFPSDHIAVVADLEWIPTTRNQ